MHKSAIKTNHILEGVRYEIRGELAARANELERTGYEIISLNIGNPGLFGYRTPETMRLAMIENLSQSEAYCHQQGIFPAREAVVMQQQLKQLVRYARLAYRSKKKGRVKVLCGNQSIPPEYENCQYRTHISRDR